jgi:hypothetical protein
MSCSAKGLYEMFVIRSRFIAVAFSLLLLVGSASAQLCPDPPSTVDLGSVCVGERASGTVPLPIDVGELGLLVEQPTIAAPFTITGLRKGDSSVVPPVTLALGETLVADIEVIVPGPSTTAQLSWGTIGGATCLVNVVANVPFCDDPDPGNPCDAAGCSEGECVPVPLPGPCDDGDACTLDDTCVDGACQPGTPRDCSDPCVTGAACVDGACTGTPVDCADTVDCTTDSCEPGVGCVHLPVDATCPAPDSCHAGLCDPINGCSTTPLTGSVCDDGDGCTVNDRCSAGRCAGQPRQCPPDNAACTDERCIAGECRSVPVNARCGTEECSAGACRPTDPAADDRGCVSVPVGEGEACTDDGVSCTDDVCTAGGCLHIPIDSRCPTADVCSSAVCAPEDDAHDEIGCVAERPPPSVEQPAPPDSGQGDKKNKKGKKPKKKGVALVSAALDTTLLSCAEDGDPCTTDVCQEGACVHQTGPEHETCLPVQGAFRKTLGLAALTRGLAADIEGGMPAGASAGRGVLTALLDRLGRVEDDLGAGAEALAGRSAALLQPATTGSIPESPAQQRARIAFTMVLKTPRQVRSFLQLVAEARARAQLRRDSARVLRRRGRLLLRGTKNLKGELRRLQQVSSSFAR